MCIVTRDEISGRLVRLLDARDGLGKPPQALNEVPEEQKRQTRNLLRAQAGLPLDPLDAFPIN